jgi:hypothetical protein
VGACSCTGLCGLVHFEDCECYSHVRESPPQAREHAQEGARCMHDCLGICAYITYGSASVSTPTHLVWLWPRASKALTAVRGVARMQVAAAKTRTVRTATSLESVLLTCRILHTVGVCFRCHDTSQLECAREV